MAEEVLKTSILVDLRTVYCVLNRFQKEDAPC